MTETKKPQLKLVGEDGNIFSIIGRGVRELRRAGYSDEEVKQFTDEVQSSESYHHALAVVMKWFDAE